MGVVDYRRTHVSYMVRTWVVGETRRPRGGWLAAQLLWRWPARLSWHAMKTVVPQAVVVGLLKSNRMV
jgi:hypothetical protein